MPPGSGFLAPASGGTDSPWRGHPLSSRPLKPEQGVFQFSYWTKNIRDSSSPVQILDLARLPIKKTGERIDALTHYILKTTALRLELG
jgi:hypothetical protein